MHLLNLHQFLCDGLNYLPSRSDPTAFVSGHYVIAHFTPRNFIFRCNVQTLGFDKLITSTALPAQNRDLVSWRFD